jgi:hypothetical protein
LAGALRVTPYNEDMLMQAVQSVGLRSAVAGLALLGGTVYGASRHHCTRSTESVQKMHRLALDAPVEPYAIYLTAWEDGDVWMQLDPSLHQTLTFSTRATISDGCRWLGTEVLEPLDDTHYAYSYDETILECAPDSVPYIKTPRVGIVTIAE